MYGLSLQTAATETPVSLDEAKKQCGVALDGSYHDDAITAYIKAATDYCERYTNRQFCTATWDLQLDSFPYYSGKFLIPRSPLMSITSITYLEATAGASTVWSSANYRVITSIEPGEVSLAYGIAFPALYPVAHPITVRFSAGYGAASAVPFPIKQAILLKVNEMFLQASGEQVRGYDDAAVSLLDSYRLGDEFHEYAECGSYE